MRQKIFLILTIVWMIVIFCYSAMDADESTKESNRVGMLLGSMVYSDFEEWTVEEQQAFAEKWDHPVRKCAHATEYAILGFFIMGASSLGEKKVRKPVLRSWGIAALYAASDELHQYFVPGRACMFTDVCIDSVGALLGIMAYCIIMLLGKVIAGIDNL